MNGAACNKILETFLGEKNTYTTYMVGGRY